MPGYLYVLESIQSGMRYVGVASNPERREWQHNSGSVKATRGKGPWKRIKLLEFPDMRVARRAEAFIKSIKRKDIIERVVNNSFLA